MSASSAAAAGVDKLTPRIGGGLETVRRWDEDAALLVEARASVPLREIMPEWYERIEGGGGRGRRRGGDGDGEGEGGSGGGGGDGDSGSSGPPPDSESKAEGSAAAEDPESDSPPSPSPSSPFPSQSPYLRDDDHEYSGDDLFLKRLALWFQKGSGMTWVNNPPCDVCGCEETTNVGTRGPLTEEEKEGGAGRVELYHCPTCNSQTTTFPRYNSPRKLFQTRRGRCGEYANLFGLYCRSVGFDVRYASDFTDHVWVEVWSSRTNRWVHADGCEGTIDAPSMYEKGWGKGLNYVLGFTKESVVDITRRYTRRFETSEFMARRRTVCMSESHGEMILAQVNSSVRAQTQWARGQQEELDRRIKEEREFFEEVQRSGASWDEGDYSEGRVSGSLAWRAARRELGPSGGSSDDNDDDGEKVSSAADDSAGASSSYFLVESFHPSPFRTSVITIEVSTPPPESSSTSAHERIVVSGVPCAVGLPNSISAVVVDERSGCILQSRSFDSWAETAAFLHGVPDGRIAAISGDDCGWDGSDDDEATVERLSRFGGLGPLYVGDGAEKSDDGEEKGEDAAGEEKRGSVLYVGQANYHPKWASFRRITNSTESVRMVATIDLSKPNSEATAPELKLRTELNAVPSLISSRLPETIMPLRTQLLASHGQKRRAFLKFVEEKEQGGGNGEAGAERYVGYATKPDCPVYLVSKSGFPLQRSGNPTTKDDKKDSWITCHYLPEPLVPDDDDHDGIFAEGNGADATAKRPAPKFDVPVDTNFFVQMLGSTLLKKSPDGGMAPPNRVDTAAALHNTRLVALYFSAHWCPPCRRFTPALAELYETVKEEVPSHGLEIVFVSSDRDPGSFNQYYNGSMPWLAVPFENRTAKETISGRYGVRGIPALVVLDAVSGRVVVTAERSRSEVMRACQGGDSAIVDLVLKDWMERRVPPETRSIMESLALSVEEEEEGNSGSKSGNGDGGGGGEENSYLVRTAEEQSLTAKNETAKKEKEVMDPSERIKVIFAKLVGEEGMDPNAAAAKAIQMVAQEQQQNDAVATSAAAEEEVVLEPGPLSECGSVEIESPLSPARVPAGKVARLSRGGDGDDDDAALKTVLTTAKKYLQNVTKSPSTPKFRSFKMSNKVFDRIVSIPDGVDLLCRLGFEFYATDADFVSCVPLAADLNLMMEEIENRLSEG